MKTRSSSRKGGFTLLETVIAIGVVAVLLTGFMYVFGPAAAGIKKAINVQQADRLVSTLEQELVTFRKGNEVGLPSKTPPTYTGFEKAFDWIKKSNEATEALLIYQYRGSLSSIRDDGTPEPMPNAKGKLPGQDYVLQTMVRKRADTNFSDTTKGDITAIEGGVYYVKCTQLIYGVADGKTGLILGKPGEIKNPKSDSTPPDPNYKAGPFNNSDDYPEAVIAFKADFYSLTNRNPSTFGATLDKAFAKADVKPMFTRNLAVRR